MSSRHGALTGTRARLMGAVLGLAVVLSVVYAVRSTAEPADSYVSGSGVSSEALDGVPGSKTDPTGSEEPTVAKRKGPLPTGVSFGGIVNDLSPAALRYDMAKVRELGTSIVRIDISWARSQPTRSTFHWADTDRVIKAARSQGLKVLAVVGYSPQWAVKPDGSPRAGAFARFMGVAAKRYKHRVDDWELWNEPNLRPYWVAKPDPADYAQLVNQAGPRIRANDPKARILIGAMAPALNKNNGNQVAPATFLRDLYAAGLRSSAFDAVSVHPYTYPGLPTGRQRWNTFYRLPDLYGIMRSNGDGAKRIWLTEYGAPTGNARRSVKPSTQAKMIVQAYRQATRLNYVGALLVYSVRDLSDDKRNVESNFGLLTASGEPKPAYGALRRELRKAD